MQTSTAEGSEKEAELLRLAELVEVYEAKHHSIGEQTDPIEAIKFRMEQMNLKKKDVAPIFGGKTRVIYSLRKLFTGSASAARTD